MPEVNFNLFRTMKQKLTYLFLLAGLVYPRVATAQDSTSTINVFLDCRRTCDESFVRDEIQFVNYVRTNEDADVHVLITRQQTGSEGQEFTLEFIGENDFTGIDDVMVFYSPESDTEDERRNGLNQYIKLGLFPYLKERPVAQRLIIDFDDTSKNTQQERSDDWNFWVFDINADTDLEGEKSENEFSLNGRLSAERITPEWKFEFEVQQYYEKQTFEDDGETDTFTRESREAEVLLVKSLGNHWSAGVSSEARHSTRSNYDLLLEASPAVEYSVFPYSEFTKREITFLYRFTGGYYDYNEVTVYGKTSEKLLQQQLSSQIRFTQPWGEFEARVVGSAFLHDFTKNRIGTDLQLDFRIFRGLSVYFRGEYDWINNQLSIPAGGITEQEQLLNLRERATSYSYELSFGLELSFGSIYNNVVNPRL